MWCAAIKQSFHLEGESQFLGCHTFSSFYYVSASSEWLLVDKSAIMAIW